MAYCCRDFVVNRHKTFLGNTWLSVVTEQNYTGCSYILIHMAEDMNSDSF